MISMLTNRLIKITPVIIAAALLFVHVVHLPGLYPILPIKILGPITVELPKEEVNITAEMHLEEPANMQSMPLDHFEEEAVFGSTYLAVVTSEEYLTCLYYINLDSITIWHGAGSFKPINVSLDERALIVEFDLASILSGLDFSETEEEFITVPLIITGEGENETQIITFQAASTLLVPAPAGDDPDDNPGDDIDDDPVTIPMIPVTIR